ncbi:uncharacterized protein PAF06_016528 [Gastrophryne carolinensis]
MEAIYQHANSSHLSFNVQKGQPLPKVWKSLWEQCEEANERLNSFKTCFPSSNKHIKVANIMKMLAVFQAEIKERNLNSEDEPLREDDCQNCGISKSKQTQLGENYKKRGEMIESHLLRPAPKLFTAEQESKTSGETSNPENTTRTLVQLLPNFSKYDPTKDPFTNMALFEDECSQHNLGSRESCLMMKLWLPAPMSARLTVPIARPAGGQRFWSNDYHWGDESDRVKALIYLVTGEDNLGIDILENLRVTPQDDPWEFTRIFEQAYRLVIDVHNSRPPPALLKSLVNKFSFLDSVTYAAASKEKTVNGIARLVDKYQRDNGLKAALAWQNKDKYGTIFQNQTPIPEDEQPRRWRREPHSFNSERPEEIDKQVEYSAVDSPIDDAVDTTAVVQEASTQNRKN